MSPLRSPPARFRAAAATLGSVVVLFGGTNGSVELNDTWTWNGKDSTGGHVMFTKYTMKSVSKSGYDWTMSMGDSESSEQEGMTGKVTRAAAGMAKPMAAKPAAQ